MTGERITIEGWAGSVPHDQVPGLVGATVAAFVGAVAEGGAAVPLGACLRFARVIEAIAKPDGAPSVCRRCAFDARWTIAVVWEIGYLSPDGNVLCEHCVQGIVTAGCDGLAFDSGPPE